MVTERIINCFVHASIGSVLYILHTSHARLLSSLQRKDQTVHTASYLSANWLCDLGQVS